MDLLIRAQFIMGSILEIGVVHKASVLEMAIDSAFNYANYLNRIWYKFYEGFEGNGDTIIVEDETDEILNLSIYYLNLTDSAFNVFYKSRNLYPVKISKNKWYFPKGLRIDLGGIAKGYVLDKIRDILISFGIDTFYIDFGGSSMYSRNYKLTINTEFGQIELFNKTLSASSTIKPIEKTYHIYNPKLSKFIKDKREVVLICNSSTFCDVFSTAIIINPKLKERIKDSVRVFEK